MISSTALCYGAGTIINAIATGKGAAFGLALETKVTVELKESGSVTAIGVENPDLFERCVKNVLKLFDYPYGATIRCESEVPIARGLKSSSIVANATVLATFGALAKRHGKIKMLRIDKELSRQQLFVGHEEITDQMILDISINSSKEAGVTITGALDDTAAAYFGGFVVTNNTENEIKRRGEMESLSAVIFVPEEKAYTKDVDVEATKTYGKEVDVLWNLALSGDLYPAMTLNGMVYSAALNRPQEIADAAMKAGALAAGLSGKGPAVIALTKNNPDKILTAWEKFDGRCIETKVNNEKAKVIL